MDMRPADFEMEHVPGARLILFSDITVEGHDQLGAELPPVADLLRVFSAAGVRDGAEVVLTGPPLATTRAFFTLDYLGHRGVRILNGGVAAWKAAGFPVETGRPAGFPPQGGAEFTPRVRPDTIVLADWIQERLESPQMTLVDARPDAEFTGSDGGMNGMHPPGHLPGARQLVWSDLVSRGGQFLPDEELRARLTAAGARAGVPVVAYCMVGMRACVVYFVARHLGFDAKLYDGSIVDWGRRKLPVKAARQ